MKVPRWSCCTESAIDDVLPARAVQPVIDLLARERDVIAVDLPGFGSSPALPKGGSSALIEPVRPGETVQQVSA